MPDDPNTGEVEGTSPPWQEVDAKTEQEVQEALRAEQMEQEHQEAESDHTLPVDSAFVVFIQDGEAFGVGQLADATVYIEDKLVHIEPSKHADSATMWRGCTEVAKDIQVHEQASKVVEAMNHHAAQIQRALQKQKQSGHSPGGSRLHVPGQ